MQSSLYRSIFAEGAAAGELRGEAKALIRLLSYRLGKLDPSVREIVYRKAEAEPELLTMWFTEALAAPDADAALRVVHKISAA